MTGTLLLSIPDLASFEAGTSLAWALVDRNGVREGRSPLAETPQVDRIVAVAPVARILYLETALPPVSLAKRNALLNYAIEDKLTIDPDTVHATVLGESRLDKGGEHVVAVVDKHWLADALQWLQQGGRAPQALVCEADAVTAKTGEWVVVPGAPHGYARRDDGFVLHLDAANADDVPFALGLALNEARNKGRTPSALALSLAQSQMGNAVALAAAWQAALNVPVRAELRNGGAALALVSSRANLLTGAFAARQSSALNRAIGGWPAAALVVLMLLLHLGFTVLDNSRMRNEREKRLAAMGDTFRAVFPDAQAVVDAPLQMQRKLAELKRERGVADVDAARRAIEQMASFAARESGAAGITPSPELMSISLTEGRMRTKWRLAEAAQRAPFMAAARAGGRFQAAAVEEPSARQVVLTVQVAR